MPTAHHNPEIGERLRVLREQIRKRLERPVLAIPQPHSPALEPLRAAQTTTRNLAGQIGTVNPRPPGLVNRLVQLFKQLISRCMDWYVRPQRDFNRNVGETLQMVSQILETTYQDVNALAQALDQFQRQSQRFEQQLCSEMDQLGERWDSQLASLQSQFEERVQLLRSGIDQLGERWDSQLASLQGQFEERVQLQQWRSEGVLMRQSGEIQERVGERIQDETKKLREQIETSLAQLQEEFRLLRQRVAARSLTESAPAPAIGIHFPKEAAKTPAPEIDYFQWERHFRGTEEEIRARLSFYIPFFRGCKSVLDLACGRGEFLELMRQENVPARGVDLNADMVGRCLQKSLDVVQSDVFQYLETVPDASLDGIFCAQFVEHLDPADYMRLASKAAAKLGPGGLLAIETQNPECLAIFSQSFFLDPTHVRPIPPAQMRLVFAEAGLERITTHFLSPASAHLPVLPSLNSRVIEAGTLQNYNNAVARFNETFFGGMDYAVIGRRPNSLAGQMRRDWDARARENALFYVANRSEPWTESEFFETGERDVREQIVDDMQTICQGKNPSEMRVLEIGCGVGRITRALARVFGDVHAVDVSPEMIARARRFLGDDPNVHLYASSGLDLDVVGHLSFDFAFSILVFQHVPSLAAIESTIDAVGRLLRPGGLFKFQVQGHPVNPATADTWVGVSVSLAEAEQIAQRCGFELRQHRGEGSQYFWLWYFKKPAEGEPCC